MLLRQMNRLILAFRKEKKALPAASPLMLLFQCGRAFFYPFLKAGLTVETACVLPLFLWAVVGGFYLIEVSAVQMRLVEGIRDAGEKMAVLSYGIYGGNSDEEREIGVGEVVGGTLSAAYAKNLILKEAGLEQTALKEETSLSLAASNFTNKNIVDIKVISKITIPIPFYRLHRMKFLERGRVRAWTGRSPTEGEGDENDEEGEMVYVAVTGTVYHRDPNCTHIHLSISSASVSAMAGKRNTGGAKYYPCSCYEAHPSGTVYYTRNGNRYHSSLNCSGLKRTVKKVKLSSLSGWKPCSKCG